MHEQTLYPPARKRFGQHFLVDEQVIAALCKVISPQPEDICVEIGPGRGALTAPLLQKLNHLNVVELDRDMVAGLQSRWAGSKKLTIYSSDVLIFDFSQITTEKHKLRVVGNLPYNISTPLLFHLFEYLDLIQDMYFMLQKEVVERMVALPDTEHYGRLSVMVQYYCDAMPLFIVPPEAFAPPPKVQSQIVKLMPHPTFPFKAEDYLHFEETVRRAFGQRRKTLRNSLKDWVSDEAWAVIGIDPSLRAETLSVEDFVKISNVVVGSFLIS